jgi:hypothetical protein
MESTNSWKDSESEKVYDGRVAVVTPATPIPTAIVMLSPTRSGINWMTYIGIGTCWTLEAIWICESMLANSTGTGPVGWKAGVGGGIAQEKCSCAHEVGN